MDLHEYLRWNDGKHLESWIEKKPVKIVDVCCKVEQEENEGSHNYLEIIQDLEHKMPKPCENTTEFNYTHVSTTGHRCTNSTGDDNDIDREVKPHWSSGTHIERGGNLARERGGRE